MWSHIRGSSPRWPPSRERSPATGSGSDPGTGEGGELPPNNWRSIFGGPAWTRTKDADGRPGEWYLHLFAPEQPDLNWTHPDVWREHEDVLRFWFDRGVAGIRIDSAALLVKDPDLADEPDAAAAAPRTRSPTATSCTRCTEVGGAIADSYPDPRVLVGEVWLPDAERFARYLRPDELHTAFNFDFLAVPGMPRRCAPRSTRRWPRTRRSVRPRPGCWRTTTSPAP